MIKIYSQKNLPVSKNLYFDVNFIKNSLILGHPNGQKIFDQLIYLSKIMNQLDQSVIILTKFYVFYEFVGLVVLQTTAIVGQMKKEALGKTGAIPNFIFERVKYAPAHQFRTFMSLGWLVRFGRDLFFLFGSKTNLCGEINYEIQTFLQARFQPP